MSYNVFISTTIHEKLTDIEDYCIEHFANYDFAEKILDEIMRVANYLSEYAGKTPRYSERLYRYVSPNIDYIFYYSISESLNKVVIEDMYAFKQDQPK